MMNTESRALIVLGKRYVLPKTLLIFIILFVLNMFLDEYEFLFAKELIVVGHSILITYVLFAQLEEYSLYFLDNRVTYFIKRVLIILVIQFWLSIWLGNFGVSVFFLFITLLISQINKHSSLYSLLIYVLIRSQESDIMASILRFSFVSEQIYVIFVMVLLSSVSLSIYLWKDIR